MNTDAMDFSILDGTLDDIADLPGFNIFPSGAYLVELTEGFVQKEIAKHPAVELQMKCIEVKELSDPATAPLAPKPGDICSTAFMLDNEFGRGKLKQALSPIGEKLGLKSNREIMVGSKGIQAIVVIKKTENKEKGREYANLVHLAPV